MRDKKRIKKLLTLILKIWDNPTHQDMRFYQLLTNIGVYRPDFDLYYQEDDETIRLLQNYLNKR